jgi:hypothetical protein
MLTWLTRLGVAAGALLIGAPAQAAVPAIDLQPDELPRGADVAIPHVEDGVLVDGDRRVDLGAPTARLIGRSGASFVVGTTAADGSHRSRIVRVRPDDGLEVLVRGVEPWDFVLSRDGRDLVHARARADATTRVRVWSARSGTLERDVIFRDYLTALDADAGRVVLSGFDRGTLEWRMSGGVRRITRRHAGRVDLGLDLFSSYTGDPYDGGCTRVARLSRPGRTLWTSCRERVEAFSPDGRSIATVHILSDGIGPGEVRTRTIDGTALARYTTTGWFGGIEWESPTALLLGTNGTTTSATVRCRLTVCANASDPERVQPPRVTAR